MTVDLTAGNGVELEGVTWQDAPVNMPIVIVRKLAKKGSRVTFWDDGRGSNSLVETRSQSTMHGG